MASTNAVWGIDIGQCALKAIKLRAAEEGRVEAVAFDVIEHAKILSQPDADRDELIKSALEKFASRNEWQGDSFIVGVPGQQTFARFCKMPPIDLKKDAKKIGDLVRYEASQQIPFDMDDVVWDYQVFTSEGSPDVEVGIFAIRRELIRKHLGYFSAAGIAPAGVQAVPAALYNFCRFDRATEEAGATVMVDVGSQNTDLIIVEPNSAWTRNIPLGGNSFTEALVRSFKLSFAKAESLKRSAADSKYARQIFQAMRPVFAELVAEIQRSIGFYSSMHRDVELKQVLALGNAFRLPGLQKYLENNLTVPGGVSKLEKFNKLVPTPTLNAPQFTENILSFGAAYGLALQGMGLSRIHASLLPPEMARIAVWRKKRPFFVAAAASLLLAAAVPGVANWLDGQALNSERSRSWQAETQAIRAQARKLRQEFDAARSDTTQKQQDIQNLLKLQKDRLVIARLLALVHEALPPTNPPDLAEITSGAELKKRIQADPERYKRTERGQFLVESFKVEYHPEVDAADLAQREGGGGPPPTMGGGGMLMGPGGAHGAGRDTGPAPTDSAAKSAGFIVRVTGRLLYRTSKSDATRWLVDYFSNLHKLMSPPGLGFYMVADDPKSPQLRAIGEPLIRPYFQASGGGPPPPAAANWPGAGGQKPGAPSGAATTEQKTPQYIDPVTGEDCRTDWSVQFAFRVRLGDAPKVEVKDQPKDKP